MMGNFGYGNMGWIGMILGSIISIALLIGLVLLIVWAVRQMSANPNRLGPQSSTGQSAREHVSRQQLILPTITDDERM